MLSSQEEQIERQRVFAQDQSVQRQATTMHAHAIADAATPRGRFSAVEAAYVVGSTATPQYPQASTPFQRDPVPDEPPLSAHDNPGFEEPSTVFSSVSSPVEQTGDPTDPAIPLAVERGGSPLSQSDDPTTEGPAPLSASPRTQPGGVGSSPVPYRRF
jgi:hypothetical protein